MSNVLVVMEQHGGAWNRMSWETLAAGQQIAASLGGTCSAAVAGHDVGALAQDLAGKKLDKVYAVEDPLLAMYTPDGFTAAIEMLVRKVQPGLVLFPHSYEVRDYAPKVATRFQRDLVSDVIRVKIDGGQPVLVRLLFQGKLNGDVRLRGTALTSLPCRQGHIGLTTYRLAARRWKR